MAAQSPKPNVVYHADCGGKDAKRWYAKAIFDNDGGYIAYAPKPVGHPGAFIERLCKEAGDGGCGCVGFDFPIGVPAFYAERAGVSSFRTLLPKLGCAEWKDFFTVCEKPEEISLYRPFYPNAAYKGRRKLELLGAHGAVSRELLLRRCDRGGEGRREACCLFWTLGPNQVGKAAIVGWRDVLAPALRGDGRVGIWPFDGELWRLIMPGTVVIVETWPAEYYAWFSKEPFGKKGNQSNRRKLAAPLVRWARTASVRIEDDLGADIQGGFFQGQDAFDAVIGLFGMLDVFHGNHASGEPDDADIRKVEGWILGRRP